VAFQQAESISPTGRGATAIDFYIPDPEAYQEEQTGVLSVQIKYSDGSMKERRFDLLARLQDDAAGQAHLVNLASLRDYVLARIDGEILGNE